MHSHVPSCMYVHVLNFLVGVLLWIVAPLYSCQDIYVQLFLLLRSAQQCFPADKIEPIDSLCLDQSDFLLPLLAPWNKGKTRILTSAAYRDLSKIVFQLFLLERIMKSLLYETFGIILKLLLFYNMDLYDRQHPSCTKIQIQPVISTLSLCSFTKDIWQKFFIPNFFLVLQNK